MADRREALTLRLLKGSTVQAEFTALVDPDDGKELRALLVDAVVTRLRKPESLVPRYRMEIKDSKGRRIRPDFVTTGG